MQHLRAHLGGGTPSGCGRNRDPTQQMSPDGNAGSPSRNPPHYGSVLSSAGNPSDDIRCTPSVCRRTDDLPRLHGRTGNQCQHVPLTAGIAFAGASESCPAPARPATYGSVHSSRPIRPYAHRYGRTSRFVHSPRTSTPHDTKRTSPTCVDPPAGTRLSHDRNSRRSSSSTNPCRDMTSMQS